MTLYIKFIPKILSIKSQQGNIQNESWKLMETGKVLQRKQEALTLPGQH